MTRWQFEDAKARFSELIEDTLKKGPQVVTRGAIETAVVVSMEEWRRLEKASRPTLKDALLGEGARFSIPLPPRAKVKSRPRVTFDD